MFRSAERFVVVFGTLLVVLVVASAPQIRRRSEDTSSSQPHEQLWNAEDTNNSTERLHIVGDNGVPQSAFPLQKCQGDCDSDNDCDMGLFCLQRDSNEPVPGCHGILPASSNSKSNTNSQNTTNNSATGRDFCYDPDDRESLLFSSDSTTNTTLAAANITLARIGNDGLPLNAFPLQKCQGDCDHDGECAGQLECLLRGPTTLLSIPGCQGMVASDDTDYCYDPNDVVTALEMNDSNNNQSLTDKGADWQPAKAFPLGLCEGDCDGDSDCEGDLVCFQRRAFQSVPSCQGVGTFDNDYCIHPEDDFHAIPSVPGSFRLKIYWERGVEWQYEFWEQEWCMRCEFGACNITDPMFVYTCNGKSTWFLFDRLLRYDGSISGRTRIRVAESNNLCLQIDENYDAILRPCNVTDASQLFHQGDGDLDGEKFALQTPNGCLAQDHHPKGGEQIFIQDCYATEYSRTKYWTKY